MTSLPSRLSHALRRTTLLVALATVALALAPAAAQARRTVVERFNLKGHGLNAEWSYQEGDILTFVSLVASSSKTRSKADGRQQDDIASLSITRSNVVTGNVEIAGSAAIDVFDLEVNGNQSRGRFRADVIFQDDNSFTFFDLHIDLSFQGIGPIEHLHDHSIDTETPNLIIRTRFDGRFRDAVATGTVYGTRRADTAPNAWPGLPHEFTPMPSSTGQIQKNRFASVTIQVGRP